MRMTQIRPGIHLGHTRARGSQIRFHPTHPTTELKQQINQKFTLGRMGQLIRPTGRMIRPPSDPKGELGRMEPLSIRPVGRMVGGYPTQSTVNKINMVNGVGSDGSDKSGSETPLRRVYAPSQGRYP